MLRELQEKFSRALYEEESAGPQARSLQAELCPLPKLSPGESIDVYRSSVSSVFEEALAEIFPVCLELVGEPCFSSVARL